jgi:hypothetical protein
MPRPARKPKTFKSNEKVVEEETVAPVASTPLHRSRVVVPGLASAGVSPIRAGDTISVYEGEGEDEELSVFPTKFPPLESRIAERPASKSEEDIYGEAAPRSESSPTTAPAIPVAQPLTSSTPARKLRTSELLRALPSRRKRHQPPRKQKNTREINTSEVDSESDSPPKPKPGRRRRCVPVEDKENANPKQAESGSEDPEILERRETVKAKFAEVDQWDLAYETVDLSFSSSPG